MLQLKLLSTGKILIDVWVKSYSVLTCSLS